MLRKLRLGSGWRMSGMNSPFLSTRFTAGRSQASLKHQIGPWRQHHALSCLASLSQCNGEPFLRPRRAFLSTSAEGRAASAIRSSPREALIDPWDVRKVDANINDAHATLSRLMAVGKENTEAAKLEALATQSRVNKGDPNATGGFIMPPNPSQLTPDNFSAILENLYMVRMKDAHEIARRSSFRLRQVRESFNVMTRELAMMQQFGIRPDYWLLSVMLECFSKFADPHNVPKTAFDITNQMKKHGHIPMEKDYAAEIALFGKARNRKGAELAMDKFLYTVQDKQEKQMLIDKEGDYNFDLGAKILHPEAAESVPSSPTEAALAAIATTDAATAERERKKAERAKKIEEAKSHEEKVEALESLAPETPEATPVMNGLAARAFMVAMAKCQNLKGVDKGFRELLARHNAGEYEMTYPDILSAMGGFVKVLARLQRSGAPASERGGHTAESKALQLWELAKRRYKMEPTVGAYNIMLEAMLVEKPLGSVMSVVEEMREAGILPNLHTYSQLFRGCKVREDAPLAAELWREMTKRNMSATTNVSYSFVMGMSAALSAKEEEHETRRSRAAMGAWASNTDRAPVEIAEEDIKLFDEGIQGLLLQRDSPKYFRGVLAAVCKRSGAEGAEKIFHKLVAYHKEEAAKESSMDTAKADRNNSQVMATAQLHEALLGFYSSEKKHEDVVRIYNVLLETLPSPPLTTQGFEQVLVALEKLDDVEGAERLWEQMISRQPPSGAAFTIMLRVMSKRSPEAAFAFYAETKKNLSVNPLYQTFLHLFSCAVNSNISLQVIDSVYKDMMLADIAPKERVFNYLMQIKAARGSDPDTGFSDACKYLRHMYKNNVKITGRSLHTLALLCKEMGDVEKLPLVFEIMEPYNVDILNETVELVCEMFVKNGKIESAVSFLDPLIKDQVGNNGVSSLYDLLAAIALEKGQPTKRITKLEAAQRWLIFFLKKRGISTDSKHFDAIDELYYEKYAEQPSSIEDPAIPVQDTETDGENAEVKE